MNPQSPPEEWIELVAEKAAEKVIARLHASKPPRDLKAEVVAFLRDHPSATVEEIAKTVPVRRKRLRDLLYDDQDFHTVPPPPNRPGNTRCWVYDPEDA